jgi:hypothetical protein
MNFMQNACTVLKMGFWEVHTDLFKLFVHGLNIRQGTEVDILAGPTFSSLFEI